MARILVTQSDAFKARDPSAPYLAESQRRRDDDTQQGVSKLGLLGKGLGLAEGVATSKAVGALLAGGARLLSAGEDVPVDRMELRRKAAESLMPKAADKVAAPSADEVTPQALMDDETAVLQDMGKRFSDEREGLSTTMAFGGTPLPTAGKPRKLTTGEMKDMREVSGREAALTGGAALPVDRMAEIEAYVARAPKDDKMRLRQEYLRERLKAMVPDAPAEEAEAPALAAKPAAPAPMEAAEVVTMRSTRDPGKILAMAATARTPAERERVMELAQSANVYAATLADLATDGHMRRFQQEVAKAFPKDDPLLALRAKNLEGTIEDRTLRRDAAAKEAAARQARFDVAAKQKVAEFEQRKQQHKDRIRVAYSQMANAKNMQDRRLAESAYQKGLDDLERDVRETMTDLRKTADLASQPLAAVPAGLAEDAQAAKDILAQYEKLKRDADTDPEITPPSEDEFKEARKAVERTSKALTQARSRAGKDSTKTLGAQQKLLPGGDLADIIGGVGNTFDQIRRARELRNAIPTLRSKGAR